MWRTILLFLSFLSATAQGLAQQEQYFSERPLFINGRSGYACYRIPAVVRAPGGDLLAFAEGRINQCDDFGNVDIVLRRSRDNGQTWDPLQRIVDNGRLQAGNPVPLFDTMDPAYPQGRLFLFYNAGNNHEGAVREGKGLREVLYVTSTDGGRSWSTPVNITSSVHRPNWGEYKFDEDWRSYANGPGHGLQLRSGPFAGRLFIPANHSRGAPLPGFQEYRSQGFYSDDHGKTWQLGEPVNVPSSNEAIAAQLTDGRLMMNCRHQSGDSRRRIVALSSNGGASWDTVYFDSSLISPVCQASLLSYTTPQGRPALLFSNPADTTARRQLTVRISYDDGRSWLLSRRIRAGSSAYSDLVEQADSLIGLLYEHGNNGGIHYAHFNYAWLTGEVEHTDSPWMRRVSGQNGLAQPFDFQLAPPLLQYDQVFFEESMTVQARLAFEGVRLHYTLDGSKPTQNTPLYTRPVELTGSGRLRIRAFHDQYRPSPVAEATFLKLSPPLLIREARLLTQPAEQYAGMGAAALVDRKKGGANFQAPSWVGFTGSDATLLVELESPRAVHRVTASVLSDPGSWIFPPKAIEVYTSDDGKNFNLTARQAFEEATAKTPAGPRFLTQHLEGQQTKWIKITIKNLPAIPEWHPGAGTPAWLFLDEILID